MKPLHSLSVLGFELRHMKFQECGLAVFVITSITATVSYLYILISANRDTLIEANIFIGNLLKVLLAICSKFAKKKNRYFLKKIQLAPHTASVQDTPFSVRTVNWFPQNTTHSMNTPYKTGLESNRQLLEPQMCLSKSLVRMVKF